MEAIIKKLEYQINESIGNNESLDDASWNYQLGAIVTINEAKKIVELLIANRHQVLVIAKTAVAGDHTCKPNYQIQNRAEIYIEIEQKKLNPDNALIDLLCETVRLCRENEKLSQTQIG